MKLAIAILAIASALVAQDQVIPFHKLPKEQRRVVEDVYYTPTARVLGAPSLVDCEVKTLDFVLDRLPMAAQLAEALDLAKYSVKPVAGAPGLLDIDDREGAAARLRVVYQQPDIRVYLAEGTLESPAMPKVAGTGVLVLLYGDAYEAEGTEAELSVFFRLKSDFLHLVTQAFRETLEKELDGRISKLIRTAMRLAERIQKDPQEVYEALKELPGVDPADVAAYEKEILGR